MTGQEIVDCAIKECRHLPTWLATAIDDAIAVGRGKEREACASFVEGAYYTRTRDALVEEIRARR